MLSIAFHWVLRRARLQSHSLELRGSTTVASRPGAGCVALRFTDRVWAWHEQTTARMQDSFEARMPSSAPLLGESEALLVVEKVNHFSSRPLPGRRRPSRCSTARKPRREEVPDECVGDFFTSYAV